MCTASGSRRLHTRSLVIRRAGTPSNSEARRSTLHSNRNERRIPAARRLKRCYREATLTREVISKERPVVIVTVPFAAGAQRQSQTACNRDRVSTRAVLVSSAFCALPTHSRHHGHIRVLAELLRRPTNYPQWKIVSPHFAPARRALIPVHARLRASPPSALPPFAARMPRTQAPSFDLSARLTLIPEMPAITR